MRAGLFEEAEEVLDDPAGQSCCVLAQGCAPVEEIRDRAVAGQDRRLFAWNAQITHQAGHPVVRKFRHFPLYALYFLLLDPDLHEVGIREVTVVRGVLLAAHGQGNPSVLVKQTGFLRNGPSGSKEIGLTPNLEFQSRGHEAERSHVLDLSAVSVSW